MVCAQNGAAPPAAGKRRKRGLALGFAAAAACLAAPPATAPGAGPPASQAAIPEAAKPPPLHASNSLGAADLFAALTEPDRTAEIDALRSIRRDLTSADDPHARDAARDRVDALLELEERRQPDVPPALVMSSLAGRIDSAIAELEQAARDPLEGGTRPDDMAPHPGVAIGAAAVVAAIIGASLASVLVSRRRLGRALSAARGAFDMAAARLNESAGAVSLAQGGSAPVVDAALSAARDATLAASRLTGAAMEAEMRLRAFLDAAELRQERAAELAGDCEAASRNVPALLAGAIEMVETRGLAAMEDAAGLLRESAGAIVSGTTTLQAGVAELAQAAGGRHEQLVEALARAENLAGELPKVAADLASSVVRLEASADGAAVPENDAAAAQSAALEAAITRAESFAGLLPDMTASLAAAAAQLRREAQAGAQTLDDACNGIARQAEAARATCERAEACTQRIGDAGEARAAADEAAAATQRMLQAEAKALADASRAQAQIAAGIGEAGAGLLASIEALAAQDAARVAALDSFVATADATLAALPRETAQLVQAARALPEGVSALVETAVGLRVEGANLAGAAAAQVEAARQAATDVAVAVGGVPRAVAALADMAVRAGTELTEAAGSMTQAACVLAREAGQREMAMDALTARADASIGALPVAAGELAAVAASVRQDTACMTAAAAQIQDAARAQEAAAASGADRAAVALGSVCLRLAEGVAGLHGASSAMREDAASLRQDSVQAASQLSMDVRQVLGTHGDRMAWLLTEGERVAGRMEAAGPARDAALSDLVDAVASTRAAAGLLADRGEAHAQAAKRVAQAALDLAAIAVPAAPAPTLPWLTGLARQTDALRLASTRLAETALRGDTRGLPVDMADDTPALLATIETCIQGLRGTATALALAGDSVPRAA